MNLIYGDIVEVFPASEARRGKVRVGGAIQVISLDLVADPASGDRVLVCEGVALGRVDGAIFKEIDYVPGHTR